MSSLSTPTRLGRGLVIPGIDTKSPLEKVNTALSYGGLHTPPQSAHESRRPSLQYAGLPDAPYSAASYTHSQPVTPIHGLNHGADFFSQRWSQSIDTQDATTSSAGPCTVSPVGNMSFQTPFGPDASYPNSMVDDTQIYSHINPENCIDNISVQPESCPSTAETWRQVHGIPATYAAHNAGLGSTLFPVPHGMNVPANSPSSIFDHASQSFATFNYYHSPNGSVCAPPGYENSMSMLQSPQVVVPSQLSPQDDYSGHHLSSYATPNRNHEDLNSSFSSSSIPFNDYEMIDPPSPQDVYFAHSEDEDFVVVKAETVSNLALDHSARRSSNLPTRSKRRASRRSRKAGKATTLCCFEVNGCVVQCEGKRCCLDPMVRLEIGSSKKQYQCKFVEEGGRPCGARFDRSEHLKRHEGKHASEDERKYFCPFESCKRKIGRPDNAGDHFKTHLRPKKTGKRNDHFEWHEVHDAIWAKYEDKKVAKKLLDGLQRWIDNGMPDTCGGRRIARAQ